MDPSEYPVARVRSATTLGIDAVPVELEVHVRSGLPSYTVVGLPQASVRESRDRVLSALRVSGFPVPRGAVTVNLAPADVRKDGSLFDLPLAAGMLAAQAAVPPSGRLSDALIVGELALDGRVRPVRGVLSVALTARESGARAVVVPVENAAEAALVRGVAVHAVATLSEAVAVLRGLTPGSSWNANGKAPKPPVPDLADVAGQGDARRALEIAAAGSHNLLMVGPPGAGKTMLARRLPSILAPLTEDEALEATRIHSVAGLRAPGEGLLCDRPFRAPHHTVSRAGLVGGGDPPRPGELSLAHNGVLFLDELPEFGRSVLETLRQPLEDGRLVLARARWRVEFPSRAMLVASMNPCPCGRLGTTGCVCDPGQVRRYVGRVSGPLLDRIDLHVHVAPLRMADWDSGGAEPSRAVAIRVAEAGRFRRQRGQREANGALDPAGVRRWCALETDSTGLLRRAVDHLDLSARAVSRIRTVARTIADLATSRDVAPEHVAEAVQYRTVERISAA